MHNNLAKKKRICIIGAGAAGQLYFTKNSVLKLLFER